MVGTIGVAVSDMSNEFQAFSRLSNVTYAAGILIGVALTVSLGTLLGSVVPSEVAYVATMCTVGLWLAEIGGVLRPPRAISRQVPVGLMFGRHVKLTALRWGIEFGTGWLTRINTWALVAMVSVLVARPSWGVAVIIILTHGAIKALPGVVGWNHIGIHGQSWPTDPQVRRF
jgi:hypothetical protein